MTQLSNRRGSALGALLAVLALLVPSAVGQVPTLFGATGPAGADDNSAESSASLSPGSRLGPWEAVLCEGSRLNMECPTGYQLRIEGGFYGRADGFGTCMDDGEVVNVMGCENPDAVESITHLCENQEHCSFMIANEVFGDPCTGYMHYLNVSFACELEAEVQTACDGDYVSMQCYAGQELRIESAAYGRQDSDTCPDSSTDMSLSCSSENSGQLLSSLCDGREWCYVQASESFFGDPCPTTSKYLEVSYTCAECENDWGNDDDCNLWASWGDCENDQQDWMYGYCRKSCTGCHLSESCLNVDSDDNCYGWAFIGECDANPDYMNIYCRRSCNLCTENYVPPTPEPAVTEWAPVLPYPEDGFYTTACPFEDAILTCNAGYHIKIFDVFYGRRNGAVCMAGTQADTLACENGSPDPFLMTSYLCNGRRSCSVWAGMPPFEDPCPGVATGRYLEIDWTCERCDNAWDSDEDCAYWQSWYECDLNRNWMNTNCFRDCSGCHLAENCGNMENDLVCDYWAILGECEANPDWMQMNCAKSCRTCWALN